MNKVVAILGVIVLITLGALFFFAGFYMGNTTTFGSIAKTGTSAQTTDSNEKKITLKDINAQIAAQSTNVSDKVLKIISGSADNISTSVTKAVTKITHQQVSQMSADALLKEIIASHSEHDNCSVETTEHNIQFATKYNKDSLRGKKVVFIGYFKDTIALQIQHLLMNKGYKVHVEESKTCHGESFIFAGPFKKTENATKLLNWLKNHEFLEAKIVNVVTESVEKTIADTLADDSTIPENEEKEIPEINQEQLQSLTGNATLPDNAEAAPALNNNSQNSLPMTTVTPEMDQQNTLPLAEQMQNLQINQPMVSDQM